MLARYFIPKLLVLVALVENLQCCTAVAFQCNIRTMPIKQSQTLPLFATIDDQKAKVASSEESAPERAFSFFGRRNIRTTETEEGRKPTGPFEVTTLKELDDYFDDVHGRFRNEKTGRVDYSALLASLSVKGDTQLIGSPNHKDVMHPVVQLLHERKRQIDKIKKTSLSSSPSSPTNTTTTSRNKRNMNRTMPPSDGFRVALAVEGGGMRGCVTAGMITAIHYLGLEDTVDVVYGSSAGTVIGAYFITRQLPWFGPELYYDALTTAGDRFINTKRFLRAVGLGLLDPRLAKDVRVVMAVYSFIFVSV